MAEEKKDFPWIQPIATVGTIMAALIGITPYILKSTPTPQTPTIVIITLPPAVTTPAPATTPVTPVETTPVVTQTTVVIPFPPQVHLRRVPEGNKTAIPTIVSNVTTTIPPTTVTSVTTTNPLDPPASSPITIALNAGTLVRGDLLFASGTTDASVPQVSISVNSTITQSGAVLTDVLLRRKVRVRYRHLGFFSWRLHHLRGCSRNPCSPRQPPSW